MSQKSDGEVQRLIKRVERLEVENALHKAKIEEYKYNTDIQAALNEIMHVSMLPLNLSEIQSRILDIMLNIEWLTLEKKGCMFGVQRPGELVMMSHKNLSASLLSMCHKVPFGNCLCGKAALEKKLIFKNCLDHEHSYRPEGIMPHGHYNAPIKDRNENVLGVLNLYVKDGHTPTKQEEVFIKSVCNVLAILFETKKLEEELRTRALTDVLTGLKNRRALVESLEQCMSRAKRNKTKLSVLFLDLNRFKPINDTYGHDVGDHVLKETARRLKEATREHDLLARLGGDEFIVVLEGTFELEKAIARIKKIINMPFELEKKMVTVGVSIGHAIFPDDSHYAGELIKLADKNMYRDKQ